MIDNNVKIFYKKILENTKENLIKNGFKEIRIFDDKENAKNYICSLIGNNKTVGIGGSNTVKSLNLIDALQQQNNKIITHTKDMDADSRIKLWFEAQKADFYIASPQAVTFDGKIIFIDAYGNRVASCIYGPKKVILIFGYNKIVKDLEDGIWRTRNVAAVINNIRLERKNPCVNKGECEDCNSSSRICNILVVLYKKPIYTNFELILINEILGY